MHKMANKIYQKRMTGTRKHFTTQNTLILEHKNVFSSHEDPVILQCS